MSASPAEAVSVDRALHRLFLALFLRGRSSRGLRKNTAPTSILSKLLRTLLLYAAVGLVTLTMLHGPVFSLAVYLHGMTLVFCGMFIASSSGEALFNKEEADILLHRPITPQTLLRAKLRVLVEVSLWIAGAFNLAGTIGGLWAENATWLFPVVHAFSTVLEALFCTACVVMGYELCLHFFGRERLENVMTTVQILMALAAVTAGQVMPRLVGRPGVHLALQSDTWWLGFLPPAWFAGFDDALAGQGSFSSWRLGGIGLILTVSVVWLALGRMARNYETGLQILSEAAPARPSGSTRRHRFAAALLQTPPVSWWVREPINQASFLLVIRYLVRDRDVKLRIYPGIAPMLVMPVVLFWQSHGVRHIAGLGSAFAGFGVAFAGVYLGMIPMLAVSLLQFSQQWPASDVFRLAPIPGPGPICAGVRQAVTLFLTLPMMLVFGLAVWLLQGSETLALLIPGLITLPIYTMMPHLGGRGVPLSVAGEEARSASRGMTMMGITLASTAIASLASWAWYKHRFAWFLAAEVIVTVILFFILRRSLASAPWISDEDSPKSKKRVAPVPPAPPL